MSEEMQRLKRSETQSRLAMPRHFVCVGVLLFSLTACGDDDGESVPDAGADAAIADTVINDTAGSGDGISDDASDSFLDDVEMVVEGETGLFHRGAVECFAADADTFSTPDIYVATNGSDDNDGLTEQTAFRTLGRALCHTRAGITVHIMPGMYNESVIISGFGTPGAAAIRIVGEIEDDEGVIFDGGETLTMGLAVAESHSIHIEGIWFRNYTDEGLYVLESTGITIKDNSFSDNGFDSVEPDFDGEGFGLIVSDCSDVSIYNNEVWENGPTEDGIMGTGIDTYALTDSIITNNTSRDNNGGGLLIEDGVRLTVNYNTITGNRLEADDWWDAGIWLDGGYDVSLSGNTISENLGPAIQVSDSDIRYPYGSCRYTVQNNTITGNYWALYVHSYGVCPLPDAGILVWDNTTADNTYPGFNTEAIAATYDDEVLCFEWPCGEEVACTDDEFDDSVEVCNE